RLPTVIDYIEKQARREMEVVKDIPLKRKDGRVLYADVASSLVFLNERPYLLGIFRDITDRKKMEEARRWSEEKFSKAFRASPNWISISLLEDGRYIEVNDAFSKITGYTREEAIGRTSVELGIWVDPEERRTMVRMLMESGSVSDLEVGFRTKAGEILTVQRSAEKIILGEEVCLISVNHDITRHRHLEEQLRQSQKMEAIGRLAGGIAHDFNNILTAILGYSDLLLLNLKPREPMYNEIEEIRKAGQRAAALTQQLLAFSRKQILKQVPLNLNTLVNNLKNMLLRIIGEDIELVTVLAPDLGQIKSDWGQVEQVIMNLAVNARDAMTHGGKLVIETANIYLDQTFVHQHPGSTMGFSVMLTVRDTGCGMETDVLLHIFEPFFTTKELGRGTGLGLSTVYGIVKQSGGYILAESIPGKGSTFKIFFPRIDQAQGPADRQDSSPLSPAESGVILVVEDDNLVRDLVRKILTMHGHLVLEAQNGEEAIRLCQDYEGRIDLLTTDVVMPGMNGPELSRRVLALRPEMKVLFMSGYSDNLFPQYGILYSGKNFIQKPFAPNDLINKIREILS
ncbi:MAG: PAS domain S-box protein, partial [Deltaproteobacteria bacterium]|nr:PAS domain S-box protein [Deltaproteobacteria bacterium]